MGTLPTRGDQDDPGEILRGLPSRERPEFLRQHKAAVDVEGTAAGAQAAMKQLLRRWRLVVVAANQAGYYEAISDAKNDIGTATPFSVALAAELANRRV